MRFITTKHALLTALTIAAKAINNSIIPIFENYLFNIDGNILEITGSSQDVSLSATIEIEGNNFKACIAIPATRLLGLIKSLPEAPIKFLIEEKKAGNLVSFSVTVTAGSGVYVVPAEDGSNFPMLKNTEQVSFELKKDDLLSGVNKSLFSCTAGGEEPFGGLLLSFEGDKVTYTGTNRFVLSTFSFPAAVDCKNDFVIPVKTLAILQSTPADDVIRISIDDNNILFRISGQVVLRSLLSAIKYPAYKGVIPTNNSNELSLKRADLIEALKRVTQFSSKVTNQVSLTIDESVFTLKAEDLDFAQQASESLFHSYKGEPITIYANGNYMISSLNKMVGEEVFIYLSTPNRAILMREKISSVDDLQNLIMVMPINP